MARVGPSPFVYTLYRVTTLIKELKMKGLKSGGLKVTAAGKSGRQISIKRVP